MMAGRRPAISQHHRADSFPLTHSHYPFALSAFLSIFIFKLDGETRQREKRESGSS